MRSRWSSCWTTCWGESSLLDLVDQVTDWSRDTPILVCMARPDLLDLRSDWGGGKLHATTVALEPLTPQEAERLVENLVRGVDDSARARIVDAAEGNPLFAEETVAMLVDDGVVKSLNVEQQPGQVDISGAEAMLKAL